MDLAHALKVALQTGTVKIGLTETVKAAEGRGAKLLIVSTSCPEPRLTGSARFDRIPIYHYAGTAVELGAACGRPFPISALAIV
ncbi:MAG: ribosomal L7Ae/L30e/S12e/Gadd45 family protein, partial [Thermoplasmata archaeon]